MARNMYGATSADFTLTSGGRVVPGSVLTIWSARTGGTQITDLTDVAGTAITSVTSGADGSVVFYGVDGSSATVWAQASQGSRIAIRPVNITGETGATPALTVGTVTTGTAAASLTGTSEAPVLNLVLPSAGANGVNTAAIQDGAVTAAKIGALTTKGDLLARDGSGAVRLPVGTDGQVLVADAAASAGVGWAASPIASNGAVHLSGTGAPEGVVSAAPSSTFTQTDASNDVKGWIRWVKATGTGNTGWVAGPEADTGWRNVTTTMEAAFKTSNANATLLVRRVGERVSWQINEPVGGSATGTVTIYSIPAGFRRAGSLPYAAAPCFNPNSGLLLASESLYVSDATMYGFGWTTNRHLADMSYSTTSAWPSSLPGTAA